MGRLDRLPLLTKHRCEVEASAVAFPPSTAHNPLEQHRPAHMTQQICGGRRAAGGGGGRRLRRAAAAPDVATREPAFVRVIKTKPPAGAGAGAVTARCSRLVRDAALSRLVRYRAETACRIDGGGRQPSARAHGTRGRAVRRNVDSTAAPCRSSRSVRVLGVAGLVPPIAYRAIHKILNTKFTEHIFQHVTEIEQFFETDPSLSPRARALGGSTRRGHKNQVSIFHRYIVEQNGNFIAISFVGRGHTLRLRDL
ncbi:hypothetical protein EVAR_56897_1 [Eumeta japonica]|uniref:Uncharacterized protein n=1 Tax=Eumeta variegata TaxID=151549 RepID=A0A4C1YF40_EUMVA|nr:hypothetical protein EVAR_56897_1 [Eumeta japonica]